MSVLGPLLWLKRQNTLVCPVTMLGMVFQSQSIAGELTVRKTRVNGNLCVVGKREGVVVPAEQPDTHYLSTKHSWLKVSTGVGAFPAQTGLSAASMRAWYSAWTLRTGMSFCTAELERQNRSISRFPCTSVSGCDFIATETYVTYARCEGYGVCCFPTVLFVP